MSDLVRQQAEAALHAAKTSWAASLAPRRALHEARDTLQDLYQTAKQSGDEGAMLAVDISRAAFEGTAARPRIALQVYQAALQSLEKGTAAAIGPLVQMASDLRGVVRDACDRSRLSEGDRNAVHDAATRRMLAALSQSAVALHAPEAPYLAYLVGMAATYSEPGQLMNMAQRVGYVSNVTSPQWYAVIASGMASNDEFEERNPAASIHAALPKIRDLAAEQKDPDATDHLARLDRYRALPGLPAETQEALELSCLRVLSDSVPGGPEAGLVLAYNALRDRQPAAVEQQLLDAAVTEARQRTYPPGSPLPAWLDFRDAVRSIDVRDAGFWRLQRACLYAMVHAQPPELSSIRGDVELYIQKAEDPGRAAAMLAALRKLNGPDIRGMVLLARTLADAASRPAVKHRLLSEAWEVVRQNCTDKQALVLAALTEQELAADPTLDRQIAALSRGLQRFERIDDDTEQQALLEAAAPSTAPPVQHVEAAEDYVLIGTLKVPRRAIDPRPGAS